LLLVGVGVCEACNVQQQMMVRRRRQYGLHEVDSDMR
jgi:hypothetical protein